MTTVYARWRRQAWLTALVVGLLALAPGTATAQIIEDPATLHIGPNVGNTSDPVQIGTSSLVTVTQNSGGVGVLDSPWQLILGIPDVTSGAPTITSVDGTAVSISGTFSGSLTSASGSTDAYTAAGFVMADTNSNNWSNWSGADQSLLGLNPSSFGLFVYNITEPPNLGAKDTVSLQFDSLSAGTFVIAYGQIASGSKITVYDTPFTEAGLETGTTSAVPEPSTIALALSGLVGFGLVGVRRFRRRAAA
jgi:hypothetical protein